MARKVMLTAKRRSAELCEGPTNFELHWEVCASRVTEKRMSQRSAGMNSSMGTCFSKIEASS
jgi:hypothetical protein